MFHSRHCGQDWRFARERFGMGWRELFGRHRHFGGWAGEQPGRPFDHGELRYILLKLIAEKPRHGYDLIKAIEERSGGIYTPSPGVVYPTLTLLEEMNYVDVAEIGNKKQYSITPAGARFLEDNRELVDEVMRRMAQNNRAWGGGPSPQIVRAFLNLKAALLLRVGKGRLNDEQSRAIAAALDRAALEIERS
jgi:DNA-binding PadR family transcriptional regulator